MKHRTTKNVLVACFLMMMVSGTGYWVSADSDTYPTHPVTFINPIPQGVIQIRQFELLTKQTENYLGQPLVLLDKAGGGTTVGVANAEVFFYLNIASGDCQ